MRKNLILPSQKNELYQVIAKAQLDPSEFEWRERPSVNTSDLIVSVLVHRPTDFYYLFDFKYDKHWTERSPGAEAGVEREYPGSWGNQLIYALEWVDCLKREIESPDLWGALAQERDILEAASRPDQNNSAFSPDEKQYISSALREIKEYLVKTHSLAEDQVGFIEDRLSYLEGASERVGRKDWVNLALATLVNIILIVALPPDAARELLRFAGQALQRILHGPFLLM